MCCFDTPTWHLASDLLLWAAKIAPPFLTAANPEIYGMPFNAGRVQYTNANNQVPRHESTERFEEKVRIVVWFRFAPREPISHRTNTSIAKTATQRQRSCHVERGSNPFCILAGLVLLRLPQFHFEFAHAVPSFLWSSSASKLSFPYMAPFFLTRNRIEVNLYVAQDLPIPSRSCRVRFSRKVIGETLLRVYHLPHPLGKKEWRYTTNTNISPRKWNDWTHVDSSACVPYSHVLTSIVAWLCGVHTTFAFHAARGVSGG